MLGLIGTGNVCMSLYDKILPAEEIEALKLYRPDSEIRMLVGEKLKFVFEKLTHGLKDKDGNPVNLDDFYFTVSAETMPNAFFISSEHTTDKKTNIICVTEGLISTLKKIDQMAAVVAHETGHYIWKELLGGNNTVFQERFADVYSVDLMMRGGYNPRYITNVLESLSGVGNVKGINLDIHGAASTRVGDVNAYMTTLSNTKGYVFNEIDVDEMSPEWEDFKTKVKHFSEQEDYSTYLESVIKQNFGTKDFDAISHNELLKLFIKELKADNINNVVRQNDLMQILRKFKFKQQPDADIVYDLVMVVFDKIEIYKNSRSLGNKNDAIDYFLAGAHVESRGKFKELIKNRQEFVSALNSFDDEKIQGFRDKIEQAGILNRYVVLFVDFDIQKETIEPQGEKNIGHIMPWYQIPSDVSYYFPDLNSFKQTNHDVLKQYAFDKFGIVRAYGDGVQEYNRLKIYEMYDRASEKRYEILEGELVAHNLFAKLCHGDIDVAGYFAELRKTGWEYATDLNLFDRFVDINFSNAYLKKITEIVYSDKEYGLFHNVLKETRAVDLEYHPDYPYRDIRIEELFKLVTESDFYKFFIQGDIRDNFRKKIGVDRNLKSLKESEIFYEIHDMLDKAEYISADEKYFNTLYKFVEYFRDKGELDSEAIVLNVILNRVKGGSFREYSIPETILNTKDRVDKILINDQLRSMNDQRREDNKRMVNRIFSKAVHDLSKNMSALKNGSREIESAIEQEFDSLKKSVLLDNLVGVCNKKFPTTVQELESIITDDLYHRYAVFYIAEYIRRGYEFDMSVIYKLRNDFRGSANINNILANWMRKHNYIQHATLVEKLSLYVFFNKKQLFSEASANKNQLIKSIVDEIIKTNTPETVQYAENILSGVDYVHGAVSPFPGDKKELEFAIQREQLIGFVSDYYAQKLGRDDNTPEYQNRAKEIAEYISGKDKFNNTKFDYMCAKTILDSISAKVLAQESVARIFDNAANRKVDNNTAVKYDEYGRVTQEMLRQLTQVPEYALACIEFLNEKLSDDSINRFCNKTAKVVYVNDYTKRLYSKQNLTIMHQNFWAANLEVRSYLMAKLLDAYKYHDDNKVINLAVDLFFDESSEYYNDAKLVLASLYDNLEDYERDLILAAVTAASQRDESNNMTGGETIGRGLKMFFAAKGAAFIKFGQLLSYMPMLDSDIRKELSTMRDNARVPTRMDLINLINSTLPETQRKKITHIGKVLGAGSFFVSVQVKYDGKDAVIALKRPNTNELTESGMNLICNVIDDLIAADPKYKPLKNIATQARLSAQSEIDINADYKKYQQAIEIYNGFSVEMSDGTTYKPDIAQWYAHGESKNGEYAYKIMEMAGGESLISDEMTAEEKHDAAMAYVTLELSILLSGQKWDTDRHQGQQNFEYNPAFKNFMIGIFDTGAQMDNAPNKFDKLMLGGLLYSLVNAKRSGKSIAGVLVDNVKKMDKFAEKFKQDTVYIDGVQRGLTALSDIMEYQKEIKDGDGNIIQESKTLTVDDFVKIINAIYKSGIVDKTVKRSVVASAILNNPMQLFQLLKSDSVENAIVVNFNPDKLKTKKLSSYTELSKEKILEKMEQDKVLGIKRGLTEKNDNLPDVKKLAMEI